MWKLIKGVSLSFGMLSMAAAAADETPAKQKPAPEISVEFCGCLRHGVMAIGGESTGTNISFNRIIWELQLHKDADRRFAEQHHKQTVVVMGSLRKVKGIEAKDRWIIDVKKLSEQDTKTHKAGVQMTIFGTLQTTNARNGHPASMAIDSAGLVWPVDVSADAKLKIAAETLVGQRILLSGYLKSDTTETETVPTIQVTQIKQPPVLPEHDELD